MQSTSVVQLSRGDARRLLRDVLNYPIFVPDLGAKVTRLLIAGDLTSFFRELDRLSSLGSRSASALFAYLYLKGAVDGRADVVRAELLCTEAAREGDPYAQYVKGWICRVSGRETEAMEWLRKASAKGLFLPAIVDVARFILGGVGVESDARAALAVLWDAHKLGHRMALIYASEILRRGHRGWLGRILGIGLYPLAVIRATRYTNRYPLSDRIFVTSASTKRPLFKIAAASRFEPDQAG